MGTGGGLVVIDFSENGNSAHFRREGWSGQEPDRVWGIGPRSVLVVPMRSTGRPIVLEAELAPVEPSPYIVGQIVRIVVNGTALGGVRIDARGMIRTEIDPAIAGREEVLRIEFGFPGFHRPDPSGVFGDDRPLSCWFSFARVYTMDMFKPGPWFPTSHPDIPVIGLSPPCAEVPVTGDGSGEAACTGGFTEMTVPFADGAWDAGEAVAVSTVDSLGQLELPAPLATGAYAILLDVRLSSVPNSSPARSITILLDRIVIGQFRLGVPSTWVVPLPSELLVGRQTLTLKFISRDADARDAPAAWSDAQPSEFTFSRIKIIRLPSSMSSVEYAPVARDGRMPSLRVSRGFLTEDAAVLPAAIEAVLGRDVISLMRGFESLGTDREFGVIQRKLGLDVLNLFRFCRGTVPDLLRAFNNDLDAMTDPDSVTIEPDDADPGEYVLALLAYNLRWPAAGHGNSALRGAGTLGYLRRKFYEGLRAGRKIYVIKQQSPVSLGQAFALLMELNRHGRATLLWVEEASFGHRPGEVELIVPRLMRGYVKQFASETNAETADPADWMRVIANATILHRGMNVDTSR